MQYIQFLKALLIKNLDGKVKRETILLIKNSHICIHILTSTMKDSLMLLEFLHFWENFLMIKKSITNYNYKPNKIPILKIVLFNSDQTQFNHHGLILKHLQLCLVSQLQANMIMIELPKFLRISHKIKMIY